MHNLRSRQTVWWVIFVLIALISTQAFAALENRNKPILPGASVVPIATNPNLTPDQERYARELAEQIYRGERQMTPDIKAFVSPYLDAIMHARHPNSFIPSTPATDAFGGPDSMGYRWMDDRETGGPTYSWITITGTAGPSGDDQTTGAVSLGFTFPYYGNNYTSCYISTNGWLSFLPRYSSIAGGWYTNTALPTADTNQYGGAPRGAIFAWWDDLSASTNAIQYLSSDTAFICSWINTTQLSGTEIIRFQVILYPNGTIKMQYSLAPTAASTLCTVGCQNTTGTVGLQMTYNANPNSLLTANRAILIYRLGTVANPTPANASTGVPTNSSLGWDPAAQADFYNLFFDTENPPVAQLGTHLTTTSYTPTLSASTTYYWQVVAFNADSSQSTSSPVWSFTTGTGSAPTPPSNAAISTNPAPTSSALTINWVDNSNNETGFPIYMKAAGDTGYVLATTAAANTTTHTFTGLSPSVQYLFRVYAENAAARSVNYSPVSGWTNPVASNAPGLSLSGQGFYTVNVTVNADLNGPNTLYRVKEVTQNMWISPSGTLDAANMRTTSRAGWNNFTISGLTSGATYTFAVYAINGMNVIAPVGPSATITTADVNHGGPDSYGYRFITSNAAISPITYEWIAPSANATTVTGWTNNYYGAAGPFQIGFSFPWYDTTFTTFYCGTEGRVQFGAQNQGYYYNTTMPIAYAGFPAGIYFWNQYMDITNATVTYEALTNPTRLVITYTNIAYNTTNLINAQVVLYQDGAVRVNYGTRTGTPVIYSAGSQDRNGTRGLMWAPPMPVSEVSYLIYKLGTASDPLPANASTNVPTNTSLSWTSAIAAIYYDVYFDTENPPVALISEHQTGTTYTPTLSAATTYYWKVVAFGQDSVTTTTSPTWSFTTGTGTAPATPSNAAIATDPTPTTSSIAITWTDNSNNETGFPIYAKASTDTVFTLVATAPANSTARTITNLSPSVMYQFRVYSENTSARSVNYASVSGWTNPVSAISPTVIPSGLGFYTVGITVRADQNGPNTLYRVKELNSNQWVSTAGTLLDSMSARLFSRPSWSNYVVSGLTSGGTYRFAAMAFNGRGVSAPIGPSATVTTNDINHGGPDGYGYRYITSNAQTGGPTYSWIDPTGNATTVTGWTSTDDGQTGPFNFGFTFPWYDTTYTTFYIGTNGRIQFGRADPYNYSSGTFPFTGYPAGVYFWNYDMSVSQTTVKYEGLTNPTRMVITYTNFYTLGSQGPIACQVILYETGLVIVNYGTLAAACPIAGAAIQDRNGARFLQYAPPIPVQNTAYMFYRLGQPSNPIPADAATGVPTNTSLSWSPAIAATTYNVFYDTENPPMAQVVTHGTDTVYTPTLAANTTYYWRVVAFGNDTALFNPGPVWSFTTGSGAAPGTPSNGAIATNPAPSTTAMTLTWQDNSTNETGFPITRSTDGTTYTALVTASPNTTSYRDTTCSPGRQYWYRVYAQNGNVVTVNYATANSWTNPVPATVPSLSPSGQGFYTIQVNSIGIDNNGSSTRYKLRETTSNRWITAAGTLDMMGIFLGTRGGWANKVVSGLTSGVTYTFEAIAVNGLGVEAAAGPSASITTNDINHGGPDAFGYRYITSNAPGGPAYSWIDPTTNAVTVTGWTSTDDGQAGPFTAPFPIVWYDTSYTQYYIGTNGRIQFGSANAYNYTTTVFPFVSYPAGIYFWNYDMSVSQTTVRYEALTNPNRLVITYTNFYSLGSQGPLAIQVIIYDNGQAMVNYGTLSGNCPFSAAAIQDRNGSRFLQYGPPQPTANTAYLFYTLGQPYAPVPNTDEVNVPQNATLSWHAAAAATGYNVYLGTTNPPADIVSTDQPGTSFAPAQLAANTTYYWKIAARNAASVNNSPIWSFTTGTGVTPTAPDSAWVTNASIISLQLHWRRTATNETGFPIYVSTADTGFVLDSTVASTLSVYTDNELLPNTQYYYRVHSANGTLRSTTFALTNGWTLASIPASPTVTSVGITSATVVINNDAEFPNPALTEYAVMVDSMYVQANGALGTTPVWKKMASWGNVVLFGLTANNDYAVRTKARNGANVETALSSSTTFTTQAAFELPFAQNFSGTAFPPPDWTVVNSDNSITWIRSTSSVSAACMPFYNYYPGNAQIDQLWSPPINTEDIQIGHVTFDWYFYNVTTNTYADTIEVVYSIDGGLTYSPFWVRSGIGTGETNLRVSPGTGGGYNTSPAVIDNWGHAETWLPTNAIGHPSVRIGFIAHNYYGPHFYVTNLSIEGAAPVEARGHVFRRDNSPVANASVRVHNIWTAQTDSSGRWSLQVPSGTWDVRISKPCMYPVVAYDNYVFTDTDTARFEDSLFVPQISASPSSLEFAMHRNEDQSQTVIVQDVGDWELDITNYISYPFDDAIDRVNPSGRLIPESISATTTMMRRGSNTNRRVPMMQLGNNSGASINTVWPIDAGSYEARDNLDGGAAYRWETITTATGAIEIWPGATQAYNAVAQVPIGFSFPFYNQQFDSLYVSSSGYLMLRNYASFPTYLALPDNYYQIAPFKYYNAHVTTSRYMYQVLDNPTRLVFTFEDVRYNNYTYQTNAAYAKTYQIILYSDGLIKFQYRNLGTLAPTTTGQGACAGIDNEGTGGINIYSDSLFYNSMSNYAVEFQNRPFQNFAIVSPEEAQIGESQILELSVSIHLDSTAIDNTDLAANMIIGTNACTTITIPVVIHVLPDSVNVNEVATGIPTAYKLHQNYPNPFNPATEIRFDLKNPGLTRLTIYNALGQEVTTLVNSYLPAGYHSVRFQGDALATGVYFYRIESGKFTSIKKMVMVK